MIRMKYLLMIVLVGLFISVFTLPALAQQQMIGLINHSIGDEFQSSMKAGAIETAEKLGYKVESAISDGDTSRQQQLIRNFSRQGAVGILLGSHSPEAADAGVQLAQSLGMKVVTLDSNPTNAIPAGTVGGKDVEAGYITGKNLAEAMDGEGKVAIWKFPTPIRPSVLRVEGFHKAFDEYPDIEVVVEQSTDFDALEAMKWAQAIIKGNPDLKGFISINNTAGIGIARGVEQADKLDQIKNATINEGREAFQAIEEGKLIGTYSMNADNFGAIGALELDRALNGKATARTVEASGVWIDENNVSEMYKYLEK